jgi:hypothetical protein
MKEKSVEKKLPKRKHDTVERALIKIPYRR